MSVDAIVAATIEIMRRDGLQAATMRRVADALDTGQASLYAYVASTSDLHAAVLERLLGDLRVTPGDDPRRRLFQLLEDYRDLLFTHPGLARSALLIRPSGPNTIAFLDGLLGLLIDHGMEPGSAAWAVDLLMLYVTAIVAEHSDDRLPATSRHAEPSESRQATRDALTAAIRDADAETRVNVARHADALLGGEPAERWAWAIEVILRGSGSAPIPGEASAPQPTGRARGRR